MHGQLLVSILLAVVSGTVHCYGGFWKVNHLQNTWRQIPEGFQRPTNVDGSAMLHPPKRPKEGIPITSVAQLKEVFQQGYRVQDMDVRGDIACLLDKNEVHPVVQTLHERKRRNSKPGERGPEDKVKIAIAVEGGGMRGCVSAGMIAVSCITDCFQVVIIGNGTALICLRICFIERHIPTIITNCGV